jgi:hypothetical protein
MKITLSQLIAGTEDCVADEGVRRGPGGPPHQKKNEFS